jgi:predicted translin family RNA/ssDNA-binding protein
MFVAQSAFAEQNIIIASVVFYHLGRCAVGQTLRAVVLITAPALTCAAFCTTSMPTLPLKIKSVALDLSDMLELINRAEEQRQSAYGLGHQIKVTVLKLRDHLGEPDALVPLRTVADEIILTTNPRQPRLANLSGRVESLVRGAAFHHFLRNGTLISRSDITFIYSNVSVTDEEYLGACLGLAHDLQRYGLARATSRDVASVQQATELVAQLQDYLLQLDFRNGPLRRKYDGTKYSLKALETFLYELTITDSSGNVNVKPQRSGKSLIPTEELQDLKQRMDRRDQQRETLIKQCRDGQKAAKQAIFALHRGQHARGLLQQCHEDLQTKLFPIVVEEPPLRAGALSSVLEEYVEARLFSAWLYGGQDWLLAADADMDNNSSHGAPVGVLLKPVDFEFELEPAEYLGGLCDLTGEIGRYAVQRGTARDVKVVQLCWETNEAICEALETMDHHLGLNKKMDMVRRSVEKIERMLYEMSLSEAAGGRNVKSNVAVDMKEDKYDGGDE